MSKACLNCGLLLKGRASKKFCDDNCRAAWHYHHKTDAANPVNTVNRLLLQNRQILRRLMSPEEDQVIASKDILLASGFHFQFHTESHIDDRGLCFHFCYDFGYAPMDEFHVQLIRIQPPDLLNGAIHTPG
ncbi:MAG: hypothetical protein QM664_03855 [Flavihumibacter sp.]